MKFNKNAFKVLKERGFIKQLTHEEQTKKMLESGPVTFYLGIDPTAENLHIGHFFALRIFKILQEHGHKGILLIGNATAMIGDPSFKSDMRKMMSYQEVTKNSTAVTGILDRFIDVDPKNQIGFIKQAELVYKTDEINIKEKQDRLRDEVVDNGAIVVGNAEWFIYENYVGFMRKVGTHFPVNKMLAAEAYKNRLDEGGLTFLEMGYMLMQAYDFIHLNNEYGCTLQIGGSDQWGNITAGVELGRRMSFQHGVERPLMVGLCCPLLINADGIKMGKTEKGTLWVSGDDSSAYDFYQHFINCDDRDVSQLLRFFTDLPVKKIEEMIKTDIRQAKKVMTYEVTKLVHGEAKAKEAQKTAEELFSKGGASKNMPEVKLNLKGKVGVLGLLAASGIVASKGEARRLIEQKGIAIDNEIIENPNVEINLIKKEYIFKKGKKIFLKVKI